MAWAKNGTPLTLGSALDDMDITDLGGLKFNTVLIHKIASGIARLFPTINNDGGSLYANRVNEDGGTDATGTSVANIQELHISGTADDFIVMYICAISGEEKLVIGHTVSGSTAGAGTAPNRYEFVSKYVPATSTDTIDRIDLNNTGAGSYDTNSNISAHGTD